MSETSVGRSESWAPLEACTLPTVEQPLRVAEFAALFATALRDLDRRSPGWLRLLLSSDVGVEVETRELIEREAQCCSFFSFELTTGAGELQLDVRVPAAHADVLDGIARQAEAALAGAGS